jgi:hypothetical protein
VPPSEVVVPVGGGSPATSITFERLLAVAFAAYVVATLVGVVMRWAFVVPLDLPPFDHMLHAHSHTLYFGWAGLAIWVLALAGRPSAPRRLRVSLWASAVLLPPLFLAYLSSGYAPASIAVSTLMMFVWYAILAFAWRPVGADLAGRHLRVASVYVVVASLGVWVLAALQATGAGTPLARMLAVHAFLSGFGWFFTIGVAGLLLRHTDLLAGALSERLAGRALIWWASLGWLVFPLSVAGGPEQGWLGTASRLAGVALVYPAWIWVKALWTAPPGPWRRVLRWLAAWLALKTAMEAAVALAGTAALTPAGRPGVVVYLHAFLLGFVTTALFAVAGAGSPLRPAWPVAHGVALVAMLVAIAGGAAAAFPAAAAAGALWLVGLGWAVSIVRWADALPT